MRRSLFLPTRPPLRRYPSDRDPALCAETTLLMPVLSASGPDTLTATSGHVPEGDTLNMAMRLLATERGTLTLSDYVSEHNRHHDKLKHL